MKVTPNGTLTGFVAIEKPSTKFDDNGVFSCQVAFTGEDAKKMKKEIDNAMAESLKNAKGVKRAANPPYTIEGKTLVVKFKQKARIVTRKGDVWEKDVKLFDAANKPITEYIAVGEGSVVKVAYDSYAWGVAALGAGITLQLQMVQVIDLVKRSSGDGGVDNPFEATEGFTAANKKTNPFEGSDDDDVEETVEDDDIDF